MKQLLAVIKGIYYRLIRIEWITAKGCNPIPVYLVEDARVKSVHMGIRVVE